MLKLALNQWGGVAAILREALKTMMFGVLRNQIFIVSPLRTRMI